MVIELQGNLSFRDTRNLLLRRGAASLQEAGIERPVFEAQLLLACALGVERADVLRDPDRSVTEDTAALFQSFVERRARREPLAYIRGTQEFYGLDFNVTPAVLIPRPETELLVDVARDLQPGIVADLGTGSGCIAIASSHHLPDAFVIGIDRSDNALEVARRNARALSANVAFAQADLLTPINSASLDLVVSNPPYIPSNDSIGLQPEVRDYEPAIALYGGSDGLDFIRRIIAECTRALRRGGRLAMEIALGQAATVGNLLAMCGFESIESRKDLAGIERVIIGRNP